MKRYFITATGTDIGKTFVTCALTWQLRQRGLRVSALKPIASGVDENNLYASDAGQLLAAQQKPVADIDAICPWRYSAPLSPDMAAQKEGVKYSFEELIAFCNAPAQSDIQFIEGVGGVMSPITQQHTVLDWIKALTIPVILVAGSYVGSISHTLTALHALTSHGITVHSIIVNESVSSAASIDETMHSLKTHMKERIALHPIARLDYAVQVWKNATNIVLPNNFYSEIFG